MYVSRSHDATCPPCDLRAETQSPAKKLLPALAKREQVAVTARVAMIRGLHPAEYVLR